MNDGNATETPREFPGPTKYTHIYLEDFALQDLGALQHKVEQLRGDHGRTLARKAAASEKCYYYW